MEKLYTLQQLAKQLGVSERTIFRYLASGDLKGSKIGGWKFTDSNVKRFLAERAKSYGDKNTSRKL